MPPPPQPPPPMSSRPRSTGLDGPPAPVGSITRPLRVVSPRGLARPSRAVVHAAGGCPAASAAAAALAPPPCCVPARAMGYGRRVRFSRGACAQRGRGRARELAGACACRQGRLRAGRRRRYCRCGVVGDRRSAARLRGPPRPGVPWAPTLDCFACALGSESAAAAAARRLGKGWRQLLRCVARTGGGGDASRMGGSGALSRLRRHEHQPRVGCVGRSAKARIPTCRRGRGRACFEGRV